MPFNRSTTTAMSAFLPASVSASRRCRITSPGQFNVAYRRPTSTPQRNAIGAPDTYAETNNRPATSAERKTTAERVPIVSDHT